MMMFFKTVLLSMRRRRKEIRFISLATFIVVLFMSSVSLFQSVMDRYVRETNYKSFGEWALASVDQEIDHPYFEMSGDCITGMPVFDAEGEVQTGFIGTVNENFIKLSNMSFYEGRLPENENEIATTMETLATMGLSYELGEEIQVQILEGEVLTTRTFSLVGIFRDFATGWQSMGEYSLPSCLVTKEALLNSGGISYTTHFYQLDRKYEDIDMAEFRTPYMSGEGSETTFFNHGAYGNRLWGSDEMLQNMQRILIVVAVLVISYLMLSYVMKRRKWYYQLRSTGASKLQIWLMIFIEGVYATVPSAIVAIALPYFIAIPVSMKISANMQVPNLFRMDWQNLMMQAVAVFGVILIAVMAACISSRDKRLSHNIHEVTEEQRGSLRRVANRGKNVANSFLRRQNRLNWRQNLMMILLTMITSGILALCVLMIYKQYDWYQMFVARADIEANMYQHDTYTYTQAYYEDEPFEMVQDWYYQDMYAGLSDDMEAQLSAIEGVANVEKVMTSRDHYLEWDGKEDSEIMQWHLKLKKEQGIVEEDLEKSVNRSCSMPIVFDDYDALYEKYGALFEEAGVRKDAFEKGEQILVVTTDVTWDVYLDDTYTEFETVVYEEKTLNTGDMVRVKAHHSVCDHEVEAAVVHMTREEYSESYNKEGNVFGEYLLFASLEFAENLATEAGKTEIVCNQVKISFDGNATYNSTIKKVAAFMERYGFTYESDWERKQEERDIFIRCCCAYGTLFIVVLSVYLILLMNTNQMKNYDRARKYQMLKRLGMSDSFFQKLVLKQGIIESLWLLAGIPVGYFMYGWVLRNQALEQSPGTVVHSTFIKKITDSWFWMSVEYIYTDWNRNCFMMIVGIVMITILCFIGIVLWSANKAIKEENA